MTTLLHYGVLAWVLLSACIGGGLALLIYGGDGLIPGILSGGITGCLMLLVMQRLYVTSQAFRNRLPRCKAGKCTADDYTVGVRENRPTLVCRCGDVYALAKDERGAIIGLDEVLPDGSTRPYMMRRGKEWVPRGKSPS